MTGLNVDYRRGRRFILCDLICSGDLLATPLVVIDAGALDAFTGSRWTKLPADKVRVHGFEPDVAECQKLNAAAANAGVDFQFHPVALGRRTGLAEFYRFAEPAANSFYPANERLIRRWCYSRSLTLASQFKVLERLSLNVISLDDWAKRNALADADFIKLNVQGAELDILRGAGSFLKNAVGLLVEQTFNATYVGAPQFGEVYEFLRSAGFCMFDVVGMNRVARTRSPIHLTEDKIFVVDGNWPHHQFLEGHFLYLRDPLFDREAWDQNTSISLEKSLKLACLAEMFGQVEYAFEILDWIAASAHAGRVAAGCREIIDRGASIYRQVSNNEVSGQQGGEVSTFMSTAVSPTAGDQLGEVGPSEQVELQPRLDAVSAENAILRATLRQMQHSTLWKMMNPVRTVAHWARSHLSRTRPEAIFKD